jgi:class 3 adenylate cyclase
MDVTEWLRGLGLERYAATFRDNEVSADLLPKLTAQDLQDLGVAMVGHRRRLLDAITALRDEAGSRGAQAGRAAAPTTALTYGDQASGAVAERRHITVLFCDLVGSTPLSTRLDPEDLRQVLETYRTSVVAAVTGKGGYVALFIGDGVLAYFGWPNADEAHADSAVRAALATIEAVRPHLLPVRIGIATGLVVVGNLIGSGAAQQHPAIGETPNLAARLQALAEPDMIVVSEATRSQLGRLFEFEELGPVALKGFETPVTAWRVRGESGVSSRSEAVYAGALTPLVGRQEELDLLLLRWREAKGGGGRVVLLSGEAGMGKSRLLAALGERLTGEPYIILRYFCSPHHQDSALYPITARLEQQAGFSRGDTAKDRLAKLEAMLAPTAPTRDDVSSLAALLSISTDGRYPALGPGPRRKEQTFATLLHRLTKFAGSGPVLILFEDAHWSDPTTLELLDAVIEQVPNLPVMLVVSFRPEFSAPWAGRPGVSLIALSQLDRGDATALARQVVANHFLPAALLNRIVLQADGVPLFIEELTKTVLASAAFVERHGAPSPLTVPTTLQAALTARLDRLPAAKQVAQVGAVIGREFPHDLLMAISSLPEQILEQGLEDLVATGLAVRRGTPPNTTYAFRHALLRDAAYGMLLRGPKRELHARIAAVLEERFPDIIEQHPAVLAQHCTQAGMAERAIAYWIKAGRKSIARSATSEAAAQFRHGFDLLPELPDGPVRRRMDLELKSSRSAARWNRVTRGSRLPRPGSNGQ